MILRRSRQLPVPPEAVWALLRDPRALPRWWPRVERVESVRGDGWTTVMRSPRGRTVRADWRLDGQDKHERRTWSQVVDGTPFAKVLRERRIEVRLAAAGAGSRIVLETQLRARRRGGGLVMRGPMGRELEGALAGLERELAERG